MYNKPYSSRRRVAAAILTIGCAAGFSPRAFAEPVKFADQGPHWNSISRKEFYSRDQGARLMPFSWFKALKRADGTGFLDDGLSRYGYLPNPDSPIPGLPVGFLAALDNEGGATLSITCAACHTRQIEIDGAPLRVDGGPGIVDLGSLFNDLDGAYDALLKDDAAFKPFAASVLGGSPSEEAVKRLKGEVQAWYFPFHKIMFAGVPKPPATSWGPARLDAVGMIFNRVAGLDIGPAPNRVIEGNLAAADAPVRYPFLWNAAIQDMTQWPGFAQNGDDITGLGRNVGEVYGVFGIFHPTPTGDPLFPLDYLKDSSLNFPGLLRLETLIKQMEAPKFPGPIDRKLADKGKEIFDRPAKEGGCGPGCHQEVKGESRLCNQNTWKTPVQNVETDARENLRLGRTGDTGVLKGQIVPQPPFNELQATDSMANILSVAVVGSIAQGPLHFGPMQFLPLVEECLRNEPITPPEKLEFFKQFLGTQLKGALNAIFRFEQVARPAYEAKVMRGIWATAPYLHNGSVPSLAELLKPPAQRVASFKIGPAYDLANVGLAKEQTKFGSYVYETTADCGGEKPDASGNSRCGHSFGTALPDEDKKALLEYLKSL